MADSLSLGAIHHVALRVTERDRSAAFYQAICGFQVVAALPDVTLLSNGTLLGLRDQPAGDYPDRRGGRRRHDQDHRADQPGGAGRGRQAQPDLPRARPVAPITLKFTIIPKGASKLIAIRRTCNAL